MQATPSASVAETLLPDATRPPGILWRAFGALLSSRTSHGDTTITLERVSFWLVLISACVRWWQGDEIPSSMASFLNLLVGAVFGQSALSTVGLVARTSAEAKLAGAETVVMPLPPGTTTSWGADRGDH